MEYKEPALTIAELLLREGFHTEVVTRNSIFDGTIPGITRGFSPNNQPLSQRSGLDPLLLMLALSKPRFRRQIHATGFFHPLQRANRESVMRFARATLPADRLALARVLDRVAELRRRRRRFFIFCNLYDVHAPYPPAEDSILRPFRSLKGLTENCMLPFVLPRLGRHSYLRPGFQLSEVSRRMLLARYHRAIELMDRKLEGFYSAARDAGFLDDTLLIITSDHGEAFGDHDLYLHDASVYQTHLHVPLWVRHPERAPEIVDDVLTTRPLT
jgi:arylsulfatase A-like enzyme